MGPATLCQNKPKPVLCLEELEGEKNVPSSISALPVMAGHVHFQSMVDLIFFSKFYAKLPTVAYENSCMVKKVWKTSCDGLPSSPKSNEVAKPSGSYQYPLPLFFEDFFFGGGGGGGEAFSHHIVGYRKNP